MINILKEKIPNFKDYIFILDCKIEFYLEKEKIAIAYNKSLDKYFIFLENNDKILALVSSSLEIKTNFLPSVYKVGFNGKFETNDNDEKDKVLRHLFYSFNKIITKQDEYRFKFLL